MKKSSVFPPTKDHRVVHDACARRVVPSPLGALLIEASASGVTRIALQGARSVNERERVGTPPGIRAMLDLAESWLRKYFDDKSPGLRPPVPLTPAGTPFQQAVWRVLCRIPFGRTTSYGALARALARPRAARAVGDACGKNPILVLIPCHRVLAAGGRLGGFSAGVHVKRWLLWHESKRRG